MTGWGLLDGSADRPRLLDCGRIRLRGEVFASRLDQLQRDLGRLISDLNPTVAAVETPFHGRNARAALQLAHARGVILAALAAAGVEIAEYTPAAVKKSVTGNGRADKEQVRRMVERLLGSAAAEQDYDVSDALAAALCHLACRRFVQAVRRASASDRRVPGLRR